MDDATKTATDAEIDIELERILAMTPEELRADCEARGTTMEAEAAQARAIFNRAIRVVDRARIVAEVLSDHGLHVSTPFDGDMDDAEQERWHACLKVSRALS
jgi:hypothetical protein